MQIFISQAVLVVKLEAQKIQNTCVGIRLRIYEPYGREIDHGDSEKQHPEAAYQKRSKMHVLVSIKISYIFSKVQLIS